MQLTEKEQALYKALKRKKQVTLTDLVNSLGGSRSAMVVRIKYLGAKLAAEGMLIERVSGIGRGAVGVYSLKKWDQK